MKAFSSLSWLACAVILFTGATSASALDLVLGRSAGGQGSIQANTPEGETFAYLPIGTVNSALISSAQQTSDDLGQPMMRLVLTPDGLAAITAAQTQVMQATPIEPVLVFLEGQQIGTLDFGDGNTVAINAQSKPVGILLIMTDATKKMITRVVAAVGQP